MSIAVGILFMASPVIVALPIGAQSISEQSPRVVEASRSAFGDASYEPNPAFPFGRKHPQAPEALSQFAFMIGEFDCLDRIRNRDGSWTETEAIWNASWFLNGYGIQDQYWSDDFATSNIRIFDPELGAWRVNFFRMPTGAVGAGQWIGRQEQTDEGPRMVMWAGSPDRLNGSRLTFFDIREDGFEWKAESLSEGRAIVTWTSSCHRRLPGREPRLPKFRGYDPEPTHPFGRKHPRASPQLEQLQDLVGSFSLAGEATKETADAQVEGGRGSGVYFLNGWGIQERHYFQDRYAAIFHLWNPAAQQWRVTRFEVPGYDWRVWDGTREGEHWVFREAPVPGRAPDPQSRRELRIEAGRGFVVEHFRSEDPESKPSKILRGERL